MKKLIVFTYLLLAICFCNCARIGSPDGGPKDSIPPVLAFAKPANKTTSFNAKKVVILFDEYIKLNQLNSQLIISPPMEKKPIIKPQAGASKKMSIEFLDSLSPNTTYTINFGNSIVDNNEGNELGNFSYVFSTGKKLDSLSIKGKITDPFSNKEVENISILAYKNAPDSLVGKHLPNYLTNTLKGTTYQLENLSNANYQIIALEDKNNNYKYDKGIERIGFKNQSIHLETPIDSMDFVLFKEPKNLKTYSPKQTSGNQIIIGFQGNVVPSVTIAGTPKANYFVSKQTNKDSLFVWFKEMVLDSISIQIQQDTLFNQYTYKLRELKKDTLLLNTTLQNILHPRDSLVFTTSTPVYSIYKDSIALLENDSIPIPFQVINQNQQQYLRIDFDRKTKKNYSLHIKKSALQDIFGNVNYPEKINFSTQDIEEYGAIIATIQNLKEVPLIVQLLEAKSLNKIEERLIKESGKVEFSNLVPKDYVFRIIKDLNQNNQFDQGNFKLQQQPEPIINVKKTITLRANSEIYENILID